MDFRHAKILKRAFLQSTVETLKPRTAHVLPMAASLQDVVKLFEMAHAGSVLILDDEEHVQGIFTERDLVLKYQPGSHLDQIKVPDVMTKPVQAITARSSIARLLHLITLGGFRHVPVLSDSGQTARIISIKDVISFIYKSVAKNVIDKAAAAAANPPSGALPAAKLVDEIMIAKFFAVSVEHLNPAKPAWVLGNAYIIDALTGMRQQGMGSLLVDNGSGKVEGIFTERDFTTRVVIPGRLVTRTKISEVMTKDPVTITSKTPIAQAFKLITEGGFRHIPVVGDDGGISGVVSSRDLIRLLTESVLDELRQALR